jgi:DNA-binding transcriptional regulator YdaS (Cro superfamily)
MRSAALLEAIRKAGSVTKLAAALDVAPQAISQWCRVPGSRVIEIERITGVPRHELRPDLYPPDNPGPRRKRSPAPELAAE